MEPKAKKKRVRKKPAPPPKLGRPSKIITHGEDILRTIESVGYFAIAAELHGIHRDTFYRWMTLAEKGEEPYATFAERARRAKSVHAQMLLCDDRVSPQWKLERLDRKLFGPAPTAEVSVNVSTTPTRAEALAELRELAKNDPEVAALLKAHEE